MLIPSCRINLIRSESAEKVTLLTYRRVLSKAPSTPDSFSAHESAQKTGTISVLIICSDRFEELIRGLASLKCIGNHLLDVRVLKNAPSVEWKKECFDDLPVAVGEKVVIFTAEKRVFPTEGRNRLAEGSTANAFLFLDDDSYLLEPAGIQQG